ncbi:MAG: response regulator transcription factor [Paracoccaceae bacterium]
MLDILSLENRNRIIVADDNEMVRDVVRAIIEHGLSADCTSASNLDEAIEIASNSQVDLALLDYNMPGMNGLNGLRRITSCNVRHIALFSGRISSDVIEEAIDLGVSGFLPKTLEPNAMLQAIRAMCVGEKFPGQHFLGKLI